MNSAMVVSPAANGSKFSIGHAPAASATANRYSAITVELTDYRGAQHKAARAFSDERDNDTAAHFFTTRMAGLWKNTAAIDEILVVGNSENIKAGSVFSLYGLA